jgi:hypothetical protein
MREISRSCESPPIITATLEFLMEKGGPEFTVLTGFTPPASTLLAPKLRVAFEVNF